MITERATDELRPLKVIYIGAGISGILAAIEFRKALPSIDLVIYEKNPEIGGTWYENRYPGCACDIPSHAYQLSFESSTDWKQFYAGAPEILDYWQQIVAKYNVRKHVRFNHKCVEAQWDDSRSKWSVKLRRLDLDESAIVVDESDVLMTGTGLLNEWKWPRIDGLKSFTGDLLHTAHWNENFDPSGKRIAVVGAGSSGIQVVPALVSEVKAMDHYVRGKTWVSPQLSEDILNTRNLKDSINGRTNFNYSAEERDAWKHDKEGYLSYRRTLEYRLQSMYEVSRLGSDENNAARRLYEKNMRERLSAKPDLIEHLIPDFPPLCKRLTPGPGYLEALTASNVSVITQPILRAYPEGLETSDGVRRPVDAIICATGFETSPEAGFPIYGRDGINLRTKYSNKPRTYLGLCTDGFPNFFQSLGPNAFQGAGSLLIVMEHLHRYVAQILQKMASSDVKTIVPKLKQVQNFTDYCEEYFKKTVFSANCVSWYRTGSRVTALWPGSSLHAVRTLESVRWEDFEYQYIDDNDFGWFGNGRILAEKNVSETTSEAITWYLNNSRFLHEKLTHGKLHEYQTEQSPNSNLIVEPISPLSSLNEEQHGAHVVRRSEHDDWQNQSTSIPSHGSSEDATEVVNYDLRHTQPVCYGKLQKAIPIAWTKGPELVFINELQLSP